MYLNDMVVRNWCKSVVTLLGVLAIRRIMKLKASYLRVSQTASSTRQNHIDATGDGDIFASAGVPFDSKVNPKMRSSHLALTFRIGRVDTKKYSKFKDSEPEKLAGLLHELESQGGFTHYIATTHDDVIWVNNAIPGLNPLDVSDLTRLEVNGRKRIQLTHQFLKNYVPGFEDCYILDTASQIGVRSSRRMIGEHVLKEDEIFSGTVFPDTIAVCPDFRHTVSQEYPHWHIPFRSLIPQRIDNLLVAGRCFSSDLIANDLLPQFSLYGDGAGQAPPLL
jgi:hypothetical protein